MRNEIIFKTSTLSNKNKKVSSESLNSSKIILKPTVYRNKALIPVDKIYYESINSEKIIPDHDQHTSQETIPLINTDELSTSVLSHTVILSPQQTVCDDENQGDIDLESTVDGKVSSADVKVAIARVDNDEFRKADVSQVKSTVIN